MNFPQLFSPLKVSLYDLKYGRKTFYGGDVAGCTDYPFHDAMAPA
jgi:hypothetical protein